MKTFTMYRYRKERAKNGHLFDYFELSPLGKFNARRTTKRKLKELGKPLCGYDFLYMLFDIAGNIKY